MGGGGNRWCRRCQDGGGVEEGGSRECRSRVRVSQGATGRPEGWVPGETEILGLNPWSSILGFVKDWGC